MKKKKSVYIHIPFCDTICTYCDFCKFYYQKDWVKLYLEQLQREIEQNYDYESIKTLYIGGGTPSSLDMDELKKLFEIIEVLDLNNCIEFTFECNVENITKEKAEFLISHKVNRISMGVETFHKRHLKKLNRHHNKQDVTEKIKMLKKVGFSNINVDLIYALPNETLEEVKEDMEELLRLNVSHISTYSLMIESHTILGVKGQIPIDEELDYEMYQMIRNFMLEHGFIHYEISNFSKPGFESQHNLVYWNNLEYYGFGIGASGYINSIRYQNTRNWNKYLHGNYKEEFHCLSQNEKIENEFILGFRKIKGISMKQFYQKYKKNIEKYSIIKQLLKEGKLEESDGNIKITQPYIYISNQILCQLIGENYE